MYFDIDSTLFNTPQFAHKHLRPLLLERLGLTEEHLLGAEQVYRYTLQKATDFDFVAYCGVLAKAGGVSVEVLLELFALREIYADCLYPEVFAVLTHLQKHGVGLGIYSEGFTEFQRRKLQFTGIIDFFIPEEVHIARRKLDTQVIAKLATGSVVIDDNLEYIDGLISSAVTPVWLNRVDDTKHSSAKTITNLTQLLTDF